MKFRKYKFRVLLIGGIFTVVLSCFIFSLHLLEYPQKYAQLIFSPEGDLMHATLAADDQWRFSPAMPVPERLKKAVVTFEDKRFFKHPGVDPLAFGRAIWQNISQWEKVSGASTLTMQLVRLGRKNAPRSIPEKLLEMFIALRFEIEHSKEDILRLWAANAPFGSNLVGFEAASWRYFGRDPQNLSWAEAALLAVLPNAPGLIFPGRNHDQLLKKRNRLIQKMQARQIIDSLTATLAIDEPLPSGFYPMPKKLPHLSQHIEKMMGKQLDNRYKVSILPALQEQLKRLATRYQKQYARQMVRNLAIVVAETHTGRVVGYVGNAGNKATPGKQVDVVQSLRSTGSLLKPFLYAGMLTEGLIAPHELIKDLPVNYSGYSPKNFNNQFFGAVKASEALSRSLNVPMVRLLRKYGVKKFHNRLRECGLKSLKKPSSHYGLSLILGGADASLFELTSMYAAMGRVLINYPRLSGRYYTQNYHSLHFGNDTLQESVYDEAPLSAGALWHTFEAMQKLVRPVSEGQWQHFSSSRRLAWKTGTSYGFRDAWAIGLDPKYTVGVWVGNASGEPRNGLVGIEKAAPVFFDVFRLLPSANNWFPKPWDNLQPILVCDHSGKPAGNECLHTHKAWLPVNTGRSGACQWCRNVLVDDAQNHRYFRQCAPKNVNDTSWFVLPPGMEWFYRRRNSDYKTLPPLAENCISTANSDNPVEFVYPHAGANFVLPLNVTGEQNEVVFQAVHRFGEARLFWYLDDQFITVTQNYHEVGIKPEPGNHILLVEDIHGNRKTLQFKILKKMQTNAAF